MPAISFGLSAFERDKGDAAQLPIINMYAERSDSEQIVLQSRRGLEDAQLDQGTTGPVAQIFKRDGIVSGSVLSVAGGRLYDDGVDVGAIVGNGPVSIAGNEIGVFVTAGAGSYYYDGTTLADIAFPDDANVTKIITGAARAIFLRADTGVFYFTPSLAATIDPLDFATAEAQADNLLDALFIDDVLVLFGTETVEFWPNTTDSIQPFVPLEAQVFEKGIKATGCATIIASTFAWVGDDDVVYINGNAPTPISNAGLEEKVAASASCSLFAFFIEGTEFLALRLDDQTYIWNFRTQFWSEFVSYGQSNFIGNCYSGGLFGSAIDNKLLRFGADYTDLGGELERRYRAGFPVNGGIAPLNNIQIRTNPGQTPNLSGDFIEPRIEMRISRDQGQTWTRWKPESLGRQGQYKTRVRWLSQGAASQPGALFEFRVVDPVPHRVSGVLINEPYGGI